MCNDVNCIEKCSCCKFCEPMYFERLAIKIRVRCGDTLAGLKIQTMIASHLRQSFWQQLLLRALAMLSAVMRSFRQRSVVACFLRRTLDSYGHLLSTIFRRSACMSAMASVSASSRERLFDLHGKWTRGVRALRVITHAQLITHTAERAITRTARIEQLREGSASVRTRHWSNHESLRVLRRGRGPSQRRTS